MTTTITNVGLGVTTAALLTGAMKYIGWGTGSGQTKASTALAAAASEARTSGAQTQQTTNVNNDTYQVAGTVTCAGAGKTISEVGLFDASTSGNMYFYSDAVGGVVLNIGDSIAFTLKVAYTAP
jgi:uncharacterized caspase-like protein